MQPTRPATGIGAPMRRVEDARFLTDLGVQELTPDFPARIRLAFPATD